MFLGSPLGAVLEKATLCVFGFLSMVLHAYCMYIMVCYSVSGGRGH